ncbi:carboxymuconolactone decarboxylase family protein [Actinomadura kijaniata]|uniref:AhpD family alkylhydroperoxidase n=1 Tax=Actinomadura namibiensis TaxID=182080 RepID=A0A7W3QPL3_ACTNM|nr:carboxymuconolactone decarboxylase family protein [Actinomadura namibiensis]MBA8954313.1 AhpD family alkylhydroperoxidase [Actinomadura namibiensis]
MQKRMTTFATHAADAYKGFLAVEGFLHGGVLPDALLHLLKLRVSQINGCAYCVDMHAHDLRKAGESDERLWSLAAWREAPFYTDEERAALALAEAATRIADNPGGVPDEIWDEAADHFDEKQLAALIAAIANINAWNRINVILRNPAGSHRP